MGTFLRKLYTNKRPPGLIAPLLRNPPKNTTKGRDLLFNEGIRLLNRATLHWIDSLKMK